MMHAASRGAFILVLAACLLATTVEARMLRTFGGGVQVSWTNGGTTYVWKNNQWTPSSTSGSQQSSSWSSSDLKQLLLSKLSKVHAPTDTNTGSTPTSDTTNNTPSSDTGNQPTGDSVGDAGLQGVLDLHNKYRASHGVSPLTWSSSTASSAQSYSSNCVFEHSHAPNLGENLAMGYQSWTAAVDAWYTEGAQYNYGNPGFSESTGHFTQMVWKGTTELGCGMSACGGRPLYVCQYSPPGNVLGKFGDNVLPPAN